MNRSAFREPLILLPTFNDWAALEAFLPRLDGELSASGYTASVMIVDDGSAIPISQDAFPLEYSAIRSLSCLRLKRNVGHQRAIAIGLSYLASKGDERPVVVMDADGEDLPSDVPRLLEEFQRQDGETVVFAKRTRRAEGLVFKIFYALYRGVHRLLTGMKVEVGNFSVLPWSAVTTLPLFSSLWNHYAAAVMQARMKTALVPTRRGSRIAGKSGMNFIALVSHGLGAMSVFSDRIGVRLMLATCGVIVLFVITGIVALALHLAGATMPDWTLAAFGIGAILLVQGILLLMVFTFMIHVGRADALFIPAREFEVFVASHERIWPGEQSV